MQWHAVLVMNKTFVKNNLMKIIMANAFVVKIMLMIMNIIYAFNAKLKCVKFV